MVPADLPRIDPPVVATTSRDPMRAFVAGAVPATAAVTRQCQESRCAAWHQSPGGRALRHALATEGRDQAGGRVQSLAPGGEGRCSRALAQWREGGGWQPECSRGGQGHGRALGGGLAGVRIVGEAPEEGMPNLDTESLQRRVVQEY